MSIISTVKSTQEQAIASWIDHLNQLRVNELMANFATQDANLANALNVLSSFKLDIDALIISNRGGEKGLHGFIAERTQVSIENARKIIDGLKGEYVLVDDNSPIDLLRSGIPIQQKFVAANYSLSAIKEHLGKYPDYIKKGGKYQIPKDFYERLYKYADMSVEKGSSLKGTERWRHNLVKKFIDETGVDFKDIEPAVVNYKDVYKDSIHETINREQDSIEKTNQVRRDQLYGESKPSLCEGVKVTAVSATIEGGIGFCLSVASKLKSGKKINEFTEQDWKDIGIVTVKGTGKGTIRGTSVYTLTNFTATPAAVASALVTASIGVVEQAQLLRKGEITTGEFIENSEVICQDATISAIASIMGQVLIPIPVLGAVVGNVVGMIIYSLAKDYLSKKEQTLIIGFNESMRSLNEQIDTHYKAFVELLEKEFIVFKSIVELAFDLDLNAAFAGSVTLAHYVGCSEEKILKDKADIEKFFLV